MGRSCLLARHGKLESCRSFPANIDCLQKVMDAVVLIAAMILNPLARRRERRRQSADTEQQSGGISSTNNDSSDSSPVAAAAENDRQTITGVSGTDEKEERVNVSPT